MQTVSFCTLHDTSGISRRLNYKCFGGLQAYVQFYDELITSTISIHPITTGPFRLLSPWPPFSICRQSQPPVLPLSVPRFLCPLLPLSGLSA